MHKNKRKSESFARRHGSVNNFNDAIFTNDIRIQLNPGSFSLV